MNANNDDTDGERRIKLKTVLIITIVIIIKYIKGTETHIISIPDINSHQYILLLL
jgi:hypothetical protein